MGSWVRGRHRDADPDPAFQPKLLRVLQKREFERVGGSKPVKVTPEAMKARASGEGLPSAPALQP